MVGHPDWFTPFMRLGTDDGLAITNKEEDAEHWMNEVEPALLQLHDFWLGRRQLSPPKRSRRSKLPQSWSQCPLPVRQRQEVQKVLRLRKPDAALNCACI
jgi:hypothetical protein